VISAQRAIMTNELPGGKCGEFFFFFFFFFLGGGGPPKAMYGKMWREESMCWWCAIVHNKTKHGLHTGMNPPCVFTHGILFRCELLFCLRVDCEEEGVIKGLRSFFVSLLVH